MGVHVLGAPVLTPSLSASGISLLGQAPISSPRPAPVVIASLHSEAVGFEFGGIVNAAPASAQWPVANLALFIPFGIPEAMTVVKLFVRNSAAILGNIDIGIYKPDGTLVIASGSTAMAGVSINQELDITDTVLNPGRYYLGMSSDTAGATQTIFMCAAAQASMISACGILQMAAAFPLPSPAVFATCAQVRFPEIGLMARTLMV